MRKGDLPKAVMALILIVILMLINLSSATTISVSQENAVKTISTPKDNFILSNLGRNQDSPVSAIVGNISTKSSIYTIIYDYLLNYTYALSTSGTLFVIADSNDSIIANISIGSGFTNMIFDPSDGYVYLYGLGSSNIAVIDGTAIYSSIYLGSGTYPTSMIYDPDYGYMLVAFTSFVEFNPLFNSFNAIPEVAAISGAQILSYWSYGIFNLDHNFYFVQNMTYDPLNGNVYISNEQMGVIAIYGTQTLIQVSPDPVSMTFDPANGLIYVACFSGEIQVIDRSGTVVDTMSGLLGPLLSSTPFLFDPANNDLLVFNVLGDMMYALNSSNSLVANISDGAPTDGIYDPANRLVYVGSVYSNYVIAINQNLKIEYNFLIEPNVTTGTSSMSMGGYNLQVYLANSNANFITIIGSDVYPVYFNPIGLPQNTSCGSRLGWSVVLNGNNKGGPSSTIEFQEMNGSFDYHVFSSGFFPSPGSGTITVSGGPVYVNINFTSSNTFEMQSQFNLSGIFLKNFTLYNLFELHLGMGPQRPYKVIAINGNSSYIFNETDCSQGIFKASINMGLLTGNTIEIIAYYNNTIQTKNITIHMINDPQWLQSVMSTGSFYVMESDYPWNNTYTIYVDNTLTFQSLFGQFINVPMVGGQYSFIPDADSSIQINSDGTIFVSTQFAYPSISVAGVTISISQSLPIKFFLYLTGEFSITNGTVQWVSSNMTISVSGSVSIPIPIVGYSFDVPDVGTVNVGLSVTISVSPTFVLEMTLAPANTTSSEFIANLDLMITRITSRISVAISAAINAGIGIASISGGGSLTYNVNMSVTPSPLTLSGNVQGSLSVNWNALMWSGTIWSSGSYTLFSWGPTTLSKISKITSQSTNLNNTNFTLTPRYYNTTNYESFRWINGQWNGTGINDIFPYTRLSSASYGNNTYLASSFDNVSLNERHGLGIRMYLANSASRNFTDLPGPMEKGFIITDPKIMMLENGSLGVLWIAVPFNSTNVSNPFLVNTTILQYSTFNPSSYNWSKPLNITNLGIANSYSIAQEGTSTYVTVIWTRNSTSQTRLLEFTINGFSFTNNHNNEVHSILNVSLPNASNIVSFRINKNGSQNLLVQFENGSYSIIYLNRTYIYSISMVGIFKIPSLNGYSIKQAGLASNSTEILFVLYESQSQGDIFACYNISNLSSPIFLSNLFMRLPQSTSSVRMIYGNETSYVGVLTLNQGKYLDRIQIFCLGRVPGWKPESDVMSYFNFTVNIRNITYFNIEKTNNAILSYALSNYGSTKYPLMNLVLTFNAITPPPAPILQIIHHNQSIISLNWTVLDGSEYHIQRYLLNVSINGNATYSIVLSNNTTSFNFHLETGGNYRFWIYAIDPFGMSQRSNIASIIYYNITFVQNGLPSGYVFQVNLNGTIRSGTNDVVFSVTNGTYTFQVTSDSSMRINPSYGKVSVSGLSVTTYIFFTTNNSYALNFTETGLPSEFQWSATIGSEIYQSTSQHLLLYLSNGSYNISFSAAGFLAYPRLLTVSINGKGQSHMITFASASTIIYKATFLESGLPAGTQWGIYLDGILSTSSGSSISVYEPNGTYAYIIQNIPGYSPATSGGNITIKGKDIYQNITFLTRQILLNLTFVIKGINTGLSWSVTIGNRTVQSSKHNITFLLPPGTYNYTITPPKGYTTNITKGTVNLSVNESIYIKASKSISTGGVNLLYYVGSGIIILLILTAIAWAFKLRRRSKSNT